MRLVINVRISDQQDIFITDDTKELIGYYHDKTDIIHILRQFEGQSFHFGHHFENSYISYLEEDEYLVIRKTHL